MDFFSSQTERILTDSRKNTEKNDFKAQKWNWYAKIFKKGVQDFKGSIKTNHKTKFNIIFHHL